MDFAHQYEHMMEISSPNLNSASYIGNEYKIKWMLEKKNHTLNIQNAIYTACIGGHLKIAKKLYEINPELNVSLFTQENACDILQILTENDDNDMTKINTNHEEVIEWIINSARPGFPWETESIGIEYACRVGNFDMVKRITSRIYPNNLNNSALITKHVYSEAFIQACEYGHFEIAQWIFITFSNILNFHESCEKAFVWACANGHTQVVLWIDSIFNKISPRSQSMSLQKSCANGHMDIAQWLYTTYSGLRTISMSRGAELLYIMCREGTLTSITWLMEKYTKLHKWIDPKRAFNIACNENNIPVAKWLADNYKSSISIITKYNMFENACELNLKNMAIWLSRECRNIICPEPNTCVLETEIKQIPQEPNIFEIPNFVIFNAFDKACRMGHISIITWMLSNWPNVDNTYAYDKTFILMCRDDNLSMIEWIKDRMITNENIISEITNEDKDGGFEIACNNICLDTIKWFIQTFPERYKVISIKYNYVGFISKIDHINYKIIRMREISDKNILRDHTCPICYDDDVKMITQCDHVFCSECVDKFIEANPYKITYICPMCRQDTKFYKIHYICSSPLISDQQNMSVGKNTF